MGGMLMHALFNGRLKYIFLVPIIIMIGFAIFFQKAFDEIESSTFEEKIVEKKSDIDLIAFAFEQFIEKDQISVNQHGKEYLIQMIEEIDRESSIFAAAYSSDLKLRTNRYVDLKYTTSIQVNQINSRDFFSPLRSSAFTKLIQENDSGLETMPYFANDPNSSLISLYFKWTSSNTASDRYLLVVGVLPDSVITQPAAWVKVGMVFQIAITYAANIGLIILLCYLGNIQTNRSNKV
jgi:hypothetical protein